MAPDGPLRVTVCPQPRSRLRPLRAPNASGAEFSPSWDSPMTPDSRSRTPALTSTTRPFGLRRLSVLMEPNPGDANEACGVLNPACARGPDGELYLFPRLVAEGNYSRIGVARRRFAQAGAPC